MKKVSVVVPVYNTEKYLDICLNSLVNQTIDDIEIIIVNDGSTDNSIKIIKKYMKQYPEKIVLLDQKNSGISVARNNGISIAKGEFIGFVDSDDFVELNMYENLYNAIKNTKSDIVVCDYKKYYTDTQNIINIPVTQKMTTTNIYENPTLINDIDYAPWNKLYKKSLFKDIEFPKNKKYEDLSTILKVFFKAQKIEKLSEALYFYRINENGETLTVNRKINDIIFILNDIVSYAKTKENYDIIKPHMKKLCVDKLFYYLILSYELNDKVYVSNFRKEIISFLNANFKYWKKYFILKADFNFITKLILSNNIVFKLYLMGK